MRSEPRRHLSMRLNAEFRKDRRPVVLEFFVAWASRDHGRSTLPIPCMPCSFGLLPHPRSGSRSPAQRSSRVTVTDRCIPLVTAAYGTRVARPARTTRLAPGGDGSRARHEGEAVL